MHKMDGSSAGVCVVCGRVPPVNAVTCKGNAKQMCAGECEGSFRAELVQHFMGQGDDCETARQRVQDAMSGRCLECLTSGDFIGSVPATSRALFIRISKTRSVGAC